MSPPGIALPGSAMGVVPGPAPVRRKISIGMLMALVLWVAVVAGGTIAMTYYSNLPGDPGAPPASWPVESKFQRDATRPTLVMFVHPHCPCTRASLGELEVLMARVSGRVSAHVFFIKPEGTAADWEKTDLWLKASAIPGVTISEDKDGREARRFHSETSGETLLYDRQGALQFQGGITSARGHAGDNSGRSALQDFLADGHASQIKTPVFGCSLGQTECKPGESNLWKP